MLKLKRPHLRIGARERQWLVLLALVVASPLVSVLVLRFVATAVGVL